MLMAWSLFWPHGDAMNIAVGKEPDSTRYDVVKASYSEGAAELMVLNEYLYSQSLSILENHKLHCLMTEHLRSDESQMKPDFNMASRHEALCNIFGEAAAMVDTYAARLSVEDDLPVAFFKFGLYQRGEEKDVGPFLDQVECANVAARLLQLGERVETCKPYEAWLYPLLFPENSWAVSDF